MAITSCSKYGPGARNYQLLLSIDIHPRLKLRNEIAAELWRIVQTHQWVLDGGPNLLPYAIQRADGIIWRDLQYGREASHSALRPSLNKGQPDPKCMKAISIGPSSNTICHPQLQKSRKIPKLYFCRIGWHEGLRLRRIRNGRDL
ncbi:hypothetical protein [Rhizobium sp. IMFF44]|uniref:hypothetical protein n=1 Tax=Rhizobium sp. IMFF44 TaxID=3342350 RepID=UPI0035B9BF12